MRKPQWDDGYEEGTGTETSISDERYLLDNGYADWLRDSIQEYVPDESTRLKALSGGHGALGTYAVMEPVYQTTMHAHALPDDIEMGVRMTAGLLAAGFGCWTYSEAAKAERRELLDDIWEDVRD